MRKYLIFASAMLLTFSLAGCGSKSGSLTGRINSAIDSIGTDGMNAADDVIDGITGSDRSDNGANGKNGYYTDGYYGDTSSSDYYSDKGAVDDADSKGYSNVNGTAMYDYDNNRNESNRIYSAGMSKNNAPYGFGMPGAENIIGNDKKIGR